MADMSDTVLLELQLEDIKELESHGEVIFGNIEVTLSATAARYVRGGS